MLAAARPVGPCQGYPNADTWIDRPMAPGVVLVGDAAGHNDPVIGQGLAIALRDVRLVGDALPAHGPKKSLFPTPRNEGHACGAYVCTPTSSRSFAANIPNKPGLGAI